MVAAGLSLAGHLALIGYGESAAGGLPVPSAPGQVVTVALQADSRQAPVSKALAARAPQTSGEQTMSPVMSNAAQNEKLFPAFYSVRYYDTKELSLKPFVTLDIPPDFALAVPGVPDDVAILLLLINEYGDVDKVVVENSLLPQEAQTVLENALSSMKFFPGQIDGVPVKSRLRIRIRLASEKS